MTSQSESVKVTPQNQPQKTEVIMFAELLPILAITFVVFVLFFLFMGVGYIFKKQPLKGSCGGVATLMGDEHCQFCGNDPNKCESNQDANPTADTQGNQPAKALGKSVM